MAHMQLCWRRVVPMHGSIASKRRSTLARLIHPRRPQNSLSANHGAWGAAIFERVPGFSRAPDLTQRFAPLAWSDCRDNHIGGRSIYYTVWLLPSPDSGRSPSNTRSMTYAGAFVAAFPVLVLRCACQGYAPGQIIVKDF